MGVWCAVHLRKNDFTIIDHCPDIAGSQQSVTNVLEGEPVGTSSRVFHIIQRTHSESCHWVSTVTTSAPGTGAKRCKVWDIVTVHMSNEAVWKLKLV